MRGFLRLAAVCVVASIDFRKDIAVIFLKANRRSPQPPKPYRAAATSSLLNVTALVLAASLPVLAATNSLTITEKAGVSTANYPVQIGRPFVTGEIANYPQAIVNGTAVPTQADVKQRWPDGTVKHAVLAFLIPNLASGATVTVTFQNQSSGNNSALSQAQMLGFDFDAVIDAGSAGKTSARSMLTNGDYSLWTSGQIAQTIVLADHSNKQTCNSHACSKYDFGTDGNHVLRPIFHATFWPSLNKYSVRYIVESANTEAMEDQNYGVTLTVGNSSPTTKYTHTAFTHTAMTRWTKQFWFSAAPGTVGINHNLSYLTATKAVPNYDATKTVPASTISGDCSAWNAAAKDIYQAGQWTIYQPQAGARSDIGPYPDWNVKWMYTGDSCIQAQALGNADLSAAWPIHVREGKAGKNILRTDAAGAGTGVGHVLSISNRPSMWPGDWFDGSRSFTQAADRLVSVGSITNGGWIYDPAHTPLPASIPYLLTGDFWYLEECWFLASMDATSNYASIYERGPTGAEGTFNHGQLRATSWMIRDRAETAELTPDAAAEKQYFQTLMNDGIADEEGIRGITGTTFQGNAVYNWGHSQTAVAGTPWWSTSGVTTPPPLEQWWRGDPTFAQADYGIDTTVTKEAMSAFEAHYLIYALGRAKELGYATGALLTWAAQPDINILTNTSLNPYLISNGRWPTTRLSDGAYFPTWAAFKSGYQAGWQNATNFDPLSSGGLTGPDGYTSYAMAAVSYEIGESNGQAAWNWVNANIYGAGAGPNAGSPKWAILPRSGAPSAPPANNCDLNSDGAVNNTDVQVAINQVLGISACGNADIDGNSRCDIVDVQRVVNAAVGGTCRVGP